LRFLADENFPHAAVVAVRGRGHDVSEVAQSAPGTADTRVLSLAAAQGRILLTFDKDFGELTHRRASSGLGGIILFRIPLPAPDQVGARLASLIDARADWLGHFAIVEPGRVRMRRLSASS
jgi:predicted nuclease of predicted toxin-antitoxin system